MRRAMEEQQGNVLHRRNSMKPPLQLNDPIRPTLVLTHLLLDPLRDFLEHELHQSNDMEDRLLGQRQKLLERR